MGSHGADNYIAKKAIIQFRWLLFLCQNGGVIGLQKRRKEMASEKSRRKLSERIPGFVGNTSLVWMMTAYLCRTAFAADIFETAQDAMQQVYTDVAGIATVGAVVCAAVCLFLMNFSKS